MPTNRPVKTSAPLGEILESYTDIEDLAEEMNEWRESIPESLTSSEKYEQVDEATNALEEAAEALSDSCDRVLELLEEASIEEQLEGRLDAKATLVSVEVSYTERKMYKGYQEPRWVRLHNFNASVAAALDFLEQESTQERMRKVLSEESMGELSSLINEISGVLSDLEGVEFPSMYG